MKVERACVALLLAAGLVVFPACAGENPDETLGEFTKGGDDRTGEYDPVVDWWKPAADHDDEWTWGRCRASPSTTLTGSSCRCGATGVGMAGRGPGDRTIWWLSMGTGT